MQSISEALSDWLRKRSHSVISAHDLACAIEDFYLSKTYDGTPIKIRKEFPESRDISRIIGQLQSARTIEDDKELPAHRVLVCPDQRAEEVLCLLDPYLYVSHLSAMQRHGLTTRNPVEAALSRPAAPLWKTLATDAARERRTRLNLDERRLGEPRPAVRARPVIPETVRGRRVRVHDMRHPGAMQQVRNSPVRVATVGQTFADTLTRPQWCGGMAHVLEVWETHAETFLQEIVAAVEAAPTKLVKVRAGYILDERLGLADDRIQAWTAFAQRGGSQVLDPEADYQDTYSEKWMISINVRATQSN